MSYVPLSSPGTFVEVIVSKKVFPTWLRGMILLLVLLCEHWTTLGHLLRQQQQQEN